jgi:hypothetical protein
MHIGYKECSGAHPETKFNGFVEKEKRFSCLDLQNLEFLFPQ